MIDKIGLFGILGHFKSLSNTLQLERNVEAKGLRQTLALVSSPSLIEHCSAVEVADALLDVHVVHEAALFVERGATLVGDVDDQVNDVAAERERPLRRAHEQLRADAASPLRGVHEQRVHAELPAARRRERRRPDQCADYGG